MFILKSELAKKTVSNLRGGIGDIIREDFFTEGEMFGKIRLCAIFTIPPGSTVGNHTNGPVAEIYYIISGSLQVTDDGVIKELGPGDAVSTGGGKYHSFVNASNKNVEMLAIIVN